MLEIEPLKSALSSEVAETVRLQNEHTRVNQVELFPKPAQIVDINPDFSFMFPAGSKITLEGKGYIPNPFMIGRRTVFLENPVQVNGENYFLEIKGYGYNGRQLFPSKHDEGDLFYGMYMDNAEREFYIPPILKKAGVDNIQLPVALMQFEEKDFVRFAMPGLAELIDARLFISPPFSNPQRVKEAIMKLIPQAASMSRFEFLEKNMRKRLGLEVSEIVFGQYQKGGKPAVKRLAEESGLVEELSGLLDEKQAGYVIRAVKSPIRVGDLRSPDIVTDRNKKIAKRMGIITRRMLELGYFNTSPNPGNWTSEGELVDFEDVFRYPFQLDQIWEVMNYHNKAYIKNFLEFVLGEGTLGYLTKHFQEGFVGHATSTSEIVSKASDILKALRA